MKRGDKYKVSILEPILGGKTGATDAPRGILIPPIELE